MQLESSGSGKSLPDLVRPTRLGSIVSQLQGIPEVSSEPLSPEQSDLKPEASKVCLLYAGADVPWGLVRQQLCDLLASTAECDWDQQCCM